jgi:hypothetical protein
MTGPEHYREAEQILNPGEYEDMEMTPFHVALAQVHATLAGVYAHNRATTELTGLLQAMLDQIRELHEARL